MLVKCLKCGNKFNTPLMPSRFDKDDGTCPYCKKEKEANNGT